MGAVSVGTNPTFSGRERRVEAYILDFDADIYGERIAIDFVEPGCGAAHLHLVAAAGGADRR